MSSILLTFGIVAWVGVGAFVLSLDWTEQFDLGITDLLVNLLFGWFIWPLVLISWSIKRLARRPDGSRVILWKRRGNP